MEHWAKMVKKKLTAQLSIYMFKVNNRNTRTKCEICSELTIKTSERRHWHRSGVFIVNFEYISHLVLSSVSVVNFEQVIANWINKFSQNWPYHNFSKNFFWNFLELQFLRTCLECCVYKVTQYFRDYTFWKCTIKQRKILNLCSKSKEFFHYSKKFFIKKLDVIMYHRFVVILTVFSKLNERKLQRTNL